MKMIDRLDRILAERDISQIDFERLAGLPPNRISKWKRGTGADKVATKYALQIARALRVPMEWLIDEDAPEEPPEFGVISADERVILDLIRDMGLGLREALARLAVSAPEPSGGRQSLPRPKGAREREKA